MAIDTNPNWDLLAQEVADGSFASKHTLGDEFYAVFSSVPTPFVYVGLRTVEFEDGTTQDNVPILMWGGTWRDHISWNAHPFEGVEPYEHSFARQYCRTDLLAGISENITQYIGAVKVQTLSQDDTISVTYDKFWIPSANEVGAERGGPYNSQRQASIEGDTLAYFSGINNNRDNTKREKYILTSTFGVAWYTRTKYYVGNSSFYRRGVYVTKRGGIESAEIIGQNAVSLFPVPCMAFIGNGPKKAGKLYSSYNNNSKLTNKLYASQNNLSKSVSKLYGSENGQSRQIF